MPPWQSWAECSPLACCLGSQVCMSVTDSLLCPSLAQCLAQLVPSAYGSICDTGSVSGSVWGKWMYSFPVAAMTDYCTLSGLKQQKCILSALEAEVQRQGVNRVGSFRDCERGPDPCFSLSFWWLLAVFGAPWLVDASPWSLPLSSGGLSSVCLSRFPSSHQDTSH